VPQFQYIGQPDANWLFDANPDPAVYEPVAVESIAPVSTKKAASAATEENS
jgi:hypothetical protein